MRASSTKVTAAARGPTWLTITNGSGSVAIGPGCACHGRPQFDTQRGQGRIRCRPPIHQPLPTALATRHARRTSRLVSRQFSSETFTRGLGSFSLGSEPTNLWHASNGCGSSLPNIPHDQSSTLVSIRVATATTARSSREPLRRDRSPSTTPRSPSFFSITSWSPSTTPTTTMRRSSSPSMGDPSRSSRATTKTRAGVVSRMGVAAGSRPRSI